MEKNPKKTILRAVAMMMKPVVRFLVNHGVTHAELSDVLKDVYVDTVIRHFDEAGRVNRSRIAVMTGLTRKEVKRVIDRAIETGTERQIQSRPEKVLAGWHNDPAFSGPYGVPLDLPYEAPDGERSFVQLVKTYGSDMSAKATLEELKRGGSVSENEGVVKALARHFHPAALSAELIARFGEVAHKVLSTTTSNLEKEVEGIGYFDRWVYADKGCTDHVISLFDKYLRERGQEFLEDLDRWFAANEKVNEPDVLRKETGVYVVHYVEEPDAISTLSDLLRMKGIESTDS